MRKQWLGIALSAAVCAPVVGCGDAFSNSDPDATTPGIDLGDAADGSLGDGDSASAASDGMVPSDHFVPDATQKGDAGPLPDGQFVDAPADSPVDLPDEGMDAPTPPPGDSGMETGPLVCTGGMLICNNACVPDDVQHCGSCTHDCTNLPHVSGATSCVAGACSFAPGSCAAGWEHCSANPDDGCETDVTQPGHCGSCSNICPANLPVCAASGGTHACATGCPAATPTLCSGATCVDTTIDPNNCKTCGTSCPGVMNGQPACASSTCTFTCNNLYSSCNGGCVNEANDPKNCGGCGATDMTKVCNGVPNGQPACTSGACTFTCNGGYSVCPGACVDEATDPKNCNGCGMVCPSVTNGTPDCVSHACGFTCNQSFIVCDGTGCTPGADPTTGMFVSPGGPTSQCGGINTACGSIQSGINAAAAQGKSMVYIAAGTYTEDVTLAPGVSLKGGWAFLGGGQWTRPCAPSAAGTVLKAASSNKTIVASSAGTVTIDTLSVASIDAASVAVGESIYGIFATNGTQLTLVNVDVTVVAGGAGAPGSAGASGIPGSAGGCPLGTGQVGQPGAPGSGGVAAWSSSGFTPSAAAGGSGAGAGSNGSTQPMGSTATNVTVSCAWSPGDGACDSATGNVTAGPGSPGCAGGGGLGGTPGTAGGSSVALFLWNASATMSSGLLRAGNGGNGGSGGQGGNAGSGGAGVAGKDATVSSIEEDYEGRIFLALTIDDDPGRDLGLEGKPGHRFFFRPDEVEPLP